MIWWKKANRITKFRYTIKSKQMRALNCLGYINGPNKYYKLFKSDKSWLFWKWVHPSVHASAALGVAKGAMMRHCPENAKVSNIKQAWKIMSSLPNPTSKPELKDSIHRAFDHGWKLINSQSGWRQANAYFWRSKALDKLEWRRRSRGNRKTSGTIYRVTATVPGSIETVSALLRDVNSMASWNRVLQVWFSSIH